MKKPSERFGLINHRSRATTRRRDRGESESTEPGPDELSSWLATQSWSAPDIRRLDVKSYLQETAGFVEGPAERLRQLAVHLENEAVALPGLSGWQALERIFTAAADLNPSDPEVHISSSIAALRLSEVGQAEDTRDNLLAISEGYARQGVAVAPGDARAHFVLGYVLYFRGKKEGALEALSQSLECDPDGSTEAWAHLYRAHVLHDAERWGEALASYERVNRSVFTGPRAWRSDVLAEQRAECLHMLGRTDEAEQELVRILDRYRKEPHIAFWAMSGSLWRLAKAASPEHLENAEAVWKSAKDPTIGGR